MGTKEASQILLAILLILTESDTAPMSHGPSSCEDTVAHLQAELQRLKGLVQTMETFILQLHSSQAERLQQVPNTHLGVGTQHRDCSEVFADGHVSSGLYVVRPDGSPTAIAVYCDMRDGGGWTVFQKRRDGTESFDRAWVEYKHGFGDLYSPDGEFWLGNDPLHHLTSQGNYELKIDMEDFEGNRGYAKYKSFRVDDEKDQYQLHVREYAGTAGDAMAASPTPPPGQKWNGPEGGGVKFSTFDHPNRDKDPDDSSPCIRHDRSGWWFSRCESGNLNGHYYNGPYQALTDDGVVWYTWRGWWYSIKSVVMAIRASDLTPTPKEDVVKTSGPASRPSA